MPMRRIGAGIYRRARLGVVVAIATLIVTAVASALALASGDAGPTHNADANPARHSGPSGRAVSAASSPVTVGTGAASPGPESDGAALQSGLASVLAGMQGCALVLRDGQPVASVSTGGPVIPASTEKLVVAAAALHVLGPDFRFVTTVVAPGPVEAGRVPRLWLVGSGDPLLATADYGALVARTDHYAAPAPLTPLEWLASTLVQAGIRSVPAGIVGVETGLSGPRYLPTWTPVEVNEHDAGPLAALGVNEGFTAWQPLLVPADDPPADAVSRLEALMRADGVAVGGIAPDGPAPAGAQVIASVTSAPLSSIVAYMLATSDNRIAELLTRMVGERTTGTGTTAAGTAAVLQVAASLGVPVTGTRMVDGSGLSRQNAATCPELLGAYRLGAQPEFAALRAGLPVAGQTGAMANEFRGTPAQGRVIAKGGWIDGVAGLVGSVSGPRGVDFAFVANGSFDFPRSLSIDQQALDALVAYASS